MKWRVTFLNNVSHFHRILCQSVWVPVSTSSLLVGVSPNLELFWWSVSTWCLPLIWLSNSDLCAASLFNPVWSLFVRCRGDNSCPSSPSSSSSSHLFLFRLQGFFPSQKTKWVKYKSFHKGRIICCSDLNVLRQTSKTRPFFHEIIVNHDSGVLSSTSPSFYLMLNPGTEEEEAAPAEC